MVGKKGAAKYILSLYTSSAVGNFFVYGRKKWPWILLAAAVATLLSGRELTNILPVAVKVLSRRTAALWTVTSPGKIIRVGLIEVLIWELTALVGLVISGWRLYKNTD